VMSWKAWRIVASACVVAVFAAVPVIALANEGSNGGSDQESNGGRAPAELSATDYMRISQLYGLYARDVDPGSPRDASWLFTDDGVFEVHNLPGGGSTVVSGMADLKPFYEEVRARQSGGTRHYNTTYLIVKTPQGARATGYMLTVARQAADQPWQITGSGVYDDTLVRTAQGWKFSKRNFTFDTFVGDPVPFPTAPIG